MKTFIAFAAVLTALCFSGCASKKTLQDFENGYEHSQIFGHDVRIKKPSKYGRQPKMSGQEAVQTAHAFIRAWLGMTVGEYMFDVRAVFQPKEGKWCVSFSGDNGYVPPGMYSGPGPIPWRQIPWRRWVMVDIQDTTGMARIVSWGRKPINPPAPIESLSTTNVSPYLSIKEFREAIASQRKRLR